MNQIHVVLVDNQDSFVYNLVDAFAVANIRCTVFRNTVSVAEILAAKPDIICLSPGPGHPREAGVMMDVIKQSIGNIPILGICLGFQALLEHFGGSVRPCGPVHGTTDYMTLSKDGMELFAGLTVDATPENDFQGHLVPVARYHSLGCKNPPKELIPMGHIEDIVMAAATADEMAIGLQFHPESILSPKGPIILERCIHKLVAAAQAQDTPSS